MTAAALPARLDKRGLVAAFEFMTAVSDSRDIGMLQRRYLRGVPGIVDADAYGFYALDEQVAPISIATERAPSGFLDDYETIGRRNDPLLASIVKNGRPIHERFLFSARSWSREPLGQLLSDWGYEHSLQGPLFIGGRIVGTLNFARRMRSAPFDKRDLVFLEWICIHMSAALQQVVMLRQAKAEAQILRAALETINVPVVATGADGALVTANHAAHGTVLSHRRAPTLRQGAREAVARNVERLAISAERAAETAFEDAEQGIAYLVRTIVASTMADYYFTTFSPAVATRGPGPGAAALTAREQQIAKLVADGLSNREIGDRLVVSANTVKDHLKRMYGKLEIHNRPEIAAWAQRNLAQLEPQDGPQDQPASRGH